MRRLFGLAVVLFAFSFSQLAHAQTLPPTSSDDLMGMSPYQSYHGGDIDSISLTSGMLNINFPFLSYPQRGKLHFSFSMFYNNRSQHIGELCISGHCTWGWGLGQITSPLPIERGDVFVGWAQKMAVFGTDASLIENQGKTDQITFYYGNWSIQDADGSKHPLANLGAFTRTGTNPYYYQYGGPWRTLDASGWMANGTFSATASQTGQTQNASIVGPDGVIYNSSTALEEDPNGNMITNGSGGFLDSLNRQIPTPPTASSSSNTGTSSCPQTLLPVDHAVLWTVPRPSGGTVNYTFCYVYVALNMPPLGSAPAATGNGARLQSIVLPNGQSWNFQYNDPGDGSTYNGSPINYGTLTEVTLPTGGTISYAYVMETGTIAVDCQNEGRWVATRSVNANDGTGSHTWSYSYSLLSSGYESTTVTDPLGNYTVHTFNAPCAGYETETQYYQNGGTLLKTVNTTYNFSGSRNAAYTNVVPTIIETTWPGGEESQVTKSYDSGFSFLDFVGYATNQSGAPNVGIYGKMLTEADSDYGSGAPGGTLRTTTNTYQALTNSAYLTNNLLESSRIRKGLRRLANGLYHL